MAMGLTMSLQLQAAVTAYSFYDKMTIRRLLMPLESLLGVGLAKLVSLRLCCTCALPAGKPFYIQVAPIGCHDACYVDDKFDGWMTPPLPAAR